MSIKETTRSVIEDYFSITGRPVATLTVEEYSKFIEIAKKMEEAVSGTHGSMYYSNSEQPVHDYHSQKEETEDHNVSENKDASEMKKIKSIDTVIQKQPSPVEKKKPSKEEMLKMLRSVSS